MSEVSAAAFFEALRTRALPAVVDDPVVEARLKAEGFETLAASGFDFAKPTRSPALFVPRRFTTHDALFEAWGETPGVRAHYSLIRHATDPVYGLDHLLGLDIPATLERRRALWKQIDESGQVEIITDGERLMCHFGESIEAANPGEVIEAGGNDAVSDFLEAAVVNMAAPTSSFRAEGTLCFDGLVWLCNSTALDDATSALRDRWLAHAAKGPNRARFEGGRLVELSLGGVDVGDALKALTAEKERETAMNELGFGATVGPVPIVAGNNARMHRGRSTAFVGFGAGHLIPHVDLWVADAELRWI